MDRTVVAREAVQFANDAMLHTPNQTDRMNVFTTICKVNGVEEKKMWCVVVNADTETEQCHIDSERPLHDCSVGRWWYKVDRIGKATLPLIEWIGLLNEILFADDIPFIGEEIGDRLPFNRRLAEMHNLKLKMAILKARSEPGVDTENPNLQYETVKALERCMPHRLTHMIINHPDVLRYLTGNEDRFKNLALSAFEFVEKDTETGLFSSTLSNLILLECSGSNSVDFRDTAHAGHEAHRLISILKVVCKISRLLATSKQRPITVGVRDDTEYAIFTNVVQLMFPVDTFYDGPSMFDAAYANQNVSHLYTAQCSSLIPIENIPDVDINASKKPRTNPVA